MSSHNANVQTDLEQTRENLRSIVRQRFEPIPGDVIVQHVLQVTGDADFPVRHAAVEALVRRRGFALRDELRVGSRPGRHILGTYATRGRSDRKMGRKAARPYTTVLESIDPIRGSCDCPDYLKGSLGLCKHLLTVLEDIHGKPRRLERARAEQMRPKPPEPTLSWIPVRPLTGAGDRLTGLRWSDVEEPRTRSRALSRARAWFPLGKPLQRALDDLSHRRTMLAALQSALAARYDGKPAVDAEPAVRKLVEEERARAERLLSHQRVARDLEKHLKTMKRKLYPYQREGVRRFLSAGRLLLADDMGLGKTIQTIACCHALYRGKRVRRGLIIVPASLKPQWIREWHDSTDVPAAIVDGRPAERAEQYEELRSGFLIMNYEQLLRDLVLVQKMAPELVVLDEAQRIKNWATKSAMYVKSLQPTYRLVLTGTPMENRLDELASILDFVDDVALAPKWRLGPWHMTERGDADAGVAGARHLDTLRTRLAQVMVRRVRKDVLKQLPPRTDVRVPVEMTIQQQVEHDEANRPIAALASIARKRPLTQPEFLRLMQLLTYQRIISNGLGQLRFQEIWPTYAKVDRPDRALLEGLLSPKLLELRNLLDNVVVQQQRRVVIFSQWRNMLRLAEWSTRDVLADAGMRAVFFTGAERMALRTRAIVDFHDDPEVRVMFLTDAGGVGLNLQRAATCCINLEMPWNPAVLEQRIGRIYRIGQSRPIDVYNLISEYGIETRIAGLVSNKKALFSGLFDGTSDEVRFEPGGSFAERIERLIDAPGVPMGEEAEADLDDAVDFGEEDGEAALAVPPGVGVETEAERIEAVGPEEKTGEMEPAGRTEGIGATDPARPTGPASSTDLSANAVVSLFERVNVTPTADGGLQLSVPPEAAAPMVAMFQQMAQLFGKVVSPPPE